jgi:uncharacterized protein
VLKKIKNILLSSLLFTLMLNANEPSFDCSKVKKDSSEGLICSSDELMNMDNKLSRIYKLALKKASKDDMLKAHQRGWIKGRNDCWKAEDEKKCMVDQYNIRIEELTKKYDISDTKDVSGSVLSGFDKMLKLQGISFHVQATNEGSLNQLKVTPSGLSIVNDVIKQEIDGIVTGAEIADINADGSPEIYVYVNSAGSGSYGSLVAYSSNNNKSITPIYLPELSDNKKLFEGYIGHDKFTIMKNTFIRRFPIYLKDDPNCCPKGGMRQIEYKLVAGEAGWLLKVKNSTVIK